MPNPLVDITIWKETQENNIILTNNFTCDKCASVFTWKDHLKRHELRIHTGGHSKCECCNKVFASEHSLCKHMLDCSHADFTSESLKIDPLSVKMKGLSKCLLGILVNEIWACMKCYAVF